MSSNKIKFVSLATILSIGGGQPAAAQAVVGVRASGMAGAFVAVADDASAVYWNPAGLATGAYVSFVVDVGRDETLAGDAQEGGAERRTGRMVAFSLPPVGFAYYRQGVYVAGPQDPVATGVLSREEVRRYVYGLTTSTFGATLLQSLGEYVVVGTTLKLVRGQAVEGTASATSTGDALDRAAELSAGAETKGDLDAGVMVAVDRVRLGLVGRNLATPSFRLSPDGSPPVELEREFRVGGAWGSGWPGKSRVVVAVDLDLTARAALNGERRDVAAGVETWWKGHRVGLRGGLRRSTVGDPRPVVAGGFAAGLTAGMFIDGHVARGSQDGRSWSVGARLTF